MKGIDGFATKIMKILQHKEHLSFRETDHIVNTVACRLKPPVMWGVFLGGLCAKRMPNRRYFTDDPKIVTDNDKCISCNNWVAVCPKKARNHSKFISFIAGRKHEEDLSRQERK